MIKAIQKELVIAIYQKFFKNSKLPFNNKQFFFHQVISRNFSLSFNNFFTKSIPVLQLLSYLIAMNEKANF